MKKRIAMIKDSVIQNIAVWEDDVDWKKQVEADGYDLADITDRFDLDMYDINDEPILEKS